MIRRYGTYKKISQFSSIGNPGLNDTDWSLDRLSQRWKVIQTPNAIQVLTFDKDDIDTLDFVSSTSNIRSTIFSIPSKSKFDIKRPSPAHVVSNSRNGRKYYPCNRNYKCYCSWIMCITSFSRFTKASRSS